MTKPEHNIKGIEKASGKKQKYLVIISLDAARALQNPSLSKGERKMANLEIYNFDHVVILASQHTEHNLVKETADQGNSGLVLFTLSAVSPIFVEKPQKSQKRTR